MKTRKTKKKTTTTTNTRLPGGERFARRRGRAGHTLVEMAVSCAIVAILMLSIGSALHVTLVATGDMTQAAALERQTAFVADQVGSDLNLAMTFTERTATSVTFTVPDRASPGDADRGPDTVRYAWHPAGAAADVTANPPAPAVPANALTRQFNGGPVCVFARDVRDFRLDYLNRLVAAAAVGPPEDRPMAGHDPAGGTSREYFPTQSNWAAQVFRPNAAAARWSPTRIRLYCRGDGTPDGVVRVQFREANLFTNIPGRLLEEVEVSELAFENAYAFVEVRFNNLKDLSTSQKYAIVLAGTTSTASTSSYGWVQSGGPAANTFFTTTNNGGILWSLPSNASSMRFSVHGTVE